MTVMMRARDITHGDIIILERGTHVVTRIARWMGYVCIGDTTGDGILADPADPIIVHKPYDPDNPARTRNRHYRLVSGFRLTPAETRGSV